MLRLVGLVVNEYPEEHPYETQRTNNDKGHLPSENLSQRRNADRCCQSTNRSTCIEDRSGKGAVLLGEILCGHLNGCREVTSLTHGQHGTAEEEQIDGNGSDGQSCHRASLDSLQGCHAVNSFNLHGYPSASSMQAGT